LSYDDAGETANTQIVLHEFGSKQLVFEVRGLPTENYKGASVGIIVEGTKGYLVMTSYDSGTVFDLDGEAVKHFSGGGDHHHYNNFQEAVRKRDHKILNADVEQGHLSSALCHVANISLRLGNSIDGKDVVSELKSIQGPANFLECWQRTTEHLATNNLENYKIQIGPRLSMDPVSETFPGNDKANDMLTREYRDGYRIPSADAV
jgi:hypothetical protein